jgi:hypothetical protein
VAPSLAKSAAASRASRRGGRGVGIDANGHILYVGRLDSGVWAYARATWPAWPYSTTSASAAPA